MFWILTRPLRVILFPLQHQKSQNIWAGCTLLHSPGTIFTLHHSREMQHLIQVCGHEVAMWRYAQNCVYLHVLIAESELLFFACKNLNQVEDMIIELDLYIQWAYSAL